MDQQHYNYQPVVIIGKKGKLGRAFSRVCRKRNLQFVALGREDIDICLYDDIERLIQHYDPWAIINAAGYTRIDDAEAEKQICFDVNTTGAMQLATACRRYGLQFLNFSTDMVFDGKKQSAYLESDTVNPLNAYGESKANAEVLVRSVHPGSLIVRSGSFFGPWDSDNFASQVLQALDEDRVFEADHRLRMSPTYLPHLVNAALDLLIGDEQGTWHLSNYTGLTWYEFATLVAGKAGFDGQYIIPAEVSYLAPRPANSVLQSEKGRMMPLLEKALEEFFAETKVMA